MSAATVKTPKLRARYADGKWHLYTGTWDPKRTIANAGSIRTLLDWVDEFAWDLIL